MAKAFEIDEEECFITALIQLRQHDRSADGSAELVVSQLGTLLSRTILKEIVGIQLVVAKELVKGPVQFIGAGFDADIDNSSGTPSKFGRVVIRRYTKLLGRIHRRNEARCVEGKHIHGTSIYQNGIRSRKASIGREVTPSGIAANRGVLQKACLGSYTRGERYQCQGVAAVQGQLGYLAILDNLAERTGGRIQNVGVPGHLQRLGHLSDFECHVNGDRLLNAHLDGLLHEALETGVLKFQAVIAGRKR